jgi:uncharacterized delta-60 repeat protein
MCRRQESRRRLPLALAAFTLAAPLYSQTADSFNPNADGAVYAMAVQTDGSVLLGGTFTKLGGVAHTNIGRVKATGAVDSTFTVAAAGGVYALAVQPDGKVVVGGSPGSLAGQGHSGLGRLNADGTLDTDFHPTLYYNVYPDPAVECLAVQADGKILVGGLFTRLAGQDRYCIGRLNSDGSLDDSFAPPSFPGNYALSVKGAMSLAVQPDGTILVCGALGSMLPNMTVFVERLNPDGGLSARLLYSTSGLSQYVATCAVQADGKVVVGGLFALAGSAYLARLNTDGTLDTTFSPLANAPVYSLATQTDGKLLVGGAFTSLGGATRYYLGRLNASGTVDTTFNPGATNAAYALALQPDGKVLVGGAFTNLNARARNYVGRLSNTDTATQTLTYDGSSLTWMRGGASPEAWRTTFDASVEGGDWFSLPEGQRISGGWASYGWTLPPDPSVVNIRARAYITGASDNGSQWFAETVSGPPVVTSQPVSRTNNAGTAAVFSVTAAGSATLGYQWRKGTTKLANGGNVSGALTNTLTLSSVLGNDAAAYSVVVTNSYGSVTSQIAMLSVVGDPAVTNQPANLTTNAGQTARFSVGVLGSAPLAYQWRKGAINLADTGNISGAHASILLLSNALAGDGGGYSVVVSNTYGTATSAVATLTVIGDPFILTPPASTSANVGATASFTVTPGGTAPWGYQWRKNGAEITGATISSLNLTNVQATDVGSFSVVVTNAFGSATSTVALLAVNLALCDSFRPDANNTVCALAVQTDGGVIVGGAFDHLGGQARSHVGRLDAQGALDASFNVSLGNDPYDTSVKTLAIQPDGKILVGGSFIYYGALQLLDLVRVDTAGTVDAGFIPGLSGFYPFISCLALQPDQKILLAGCFETLGWQRHTNLGRLEFSGAMDTNFVGTTEFAAYPTDGRVYAMALQPDGKVLLGGIFNTLCGTARKHLGRLNANGTLDTAFNPGAEGYVYCLTLQADGKILVGGSFTNLAGQARSRLGRLLSDGTLDAAFNPGADGYISSLALQADGKILTGGAFTNLAGRAFNRLGRLNPDGSTDTTFIPGADATVYALALQADGKVLAGGSFQTLAAQPRSRLGRLNNTEPATQSLTRNGASLTWLRGGTSPEVWRTSFEASTNGADWFSLGAGTRVAGGWQLTGLTVATNAAICARGFVTGAYGSASSWFVESTLPGTFQNLPTILIADGGCGFHTNRFGFNLRATPGQVVVVEASTNFVQWTPLQTNFTTSLGQIIFNDSKSAGFGHRFYRARLYQGPLPPPAIRAPGGSFQAGPFGFNLAGVPGQTLIVEASTNLLSWTALATNTLGPDALYFSDAGSTIWPRRFYRARVQ